MRLITLFLLSAFAPLFGWADVTGAQARGALQDQDGKLAVGVIYARRLTPLDGSRTEVQLGGSTAARTNALGEFVLERLPVGQYSLCVAMDDPALLSHCEAFPSLTIDVGTKEAPPLLLRAVKGVQIQLAISDKTGALAIGKKLKVGVMSEGGYYRQAMVVDRRHGFLSFRATIPPGNLRQFVFLDLDPAIVLRDDRGMVWDGQASRVPIDTKAESQTFRFEVAWSGKGIGVD